MPLSLTSLVSTMCGVGEARAAALASLGILTVGDLIRHYPRGYQRRGDVRTVAEAAEQIRAGNEMPVSLILTVSAEPSYRVIRRGMSVLRLRAFDETGVCEITYFNQSFLKNTFHTGGEFRFFGRATLEGRILKMSSPIWEPCIPERALPAIVPVYRLAAGLSQKVLAGLIRDAITAVFAQIPETLPPEVMSRASLCTLPFSMRHIHMTPADAEACGVKDKDMVSVRIENTGRALTFDDVVVRVSNNYAFAMHIDTDESNAACASGKVMGEIIVRK